MEQGVTGYLRSIAALLLLLELTYVDMFRNV